MSRDDHLVTWADDSTLSSGVVDAVADALGVDPLTLGPLYDVIDPDALDSLFRTSAPASPADRVEFTFEGHSVAVYGVGRVEVTPESTDSSSDGGCLPIDGVRRGPAKSRDSAER